MSLCGTLAQNPRIGVRAETYGEMNMEQVTKVWADEIAGIVDEFQALKAKVAELEKLIEALAQAGK